MVDMEKNNVLKTSDYNQFISAGDIDEDGIVFTFDEIVQKEGRFEVEKELDDGTVAKVKKPFWVVSGFDEKGMDISITLGSAKLHRMIMDNFSLLKGAKIRLAGQGKNFEREYTITILR